MDLFRTREDKMTMEAVGGLGQEDIIRAIDDPRPQRKRLITVGCDLLSSS
jgi:hypothetical protein